MFSNGCGNSLSAKENLFAVILMLSITKVKRKSSLRLTIHGSLQNGMEPMHVHDGLLMGIISMNMDLNIHMVLEELLLMSMGFLTELTSLVHDVCMLLSSMNGMIFSLVMGLFCATMQHLFVCFPPSICMMWYLVLGVHICLLISVPIEQVFI